MKYTKEQIDAQFIITMKKEYNMELVKIGVNPNSALPKKYRDHVNDMYKSWMKILHEDGQITDDQLKSFTTPLWAYNLNLWKY